MGNKYSLNVPKKNWKKHLNSIHKFQDPVIIINQSMKIENSNHAFLHFIGISSSKAALQRSLSLFSAKNQPHLNSDTETALLTTSQRALQEKSGVFNVVWLFINIKTELTKWGACSVTFLQTNNKSLAQVIIYPCNPPVRQESLGPKSSPLSIRIKPQVKLTKSQSLIIRPTFSPPRNETQKFITPQESTALTNSIKSSLEKIPKKQQMKNEIDNIHGILEKVGDDQFKCLISTKISEIYSFIEKKVTQKEAEITALSESLLQERKKNEKQLKRLETHLEERMGGMESVKSQKQSLLHDNLLLKRKLKQVTLLVENQKRITDKLYGIVNFNNETKSLQNNEESENSLNSEITFKLENSKNLSDSILTSTSSSTSVLSLNEDLENQELIDQDFENEDLQNQDILDHKNFVIFDPFDEN
ncbi:hypothetical protein M0811_13087 [Anaeramoeba ignava]|uniref:Uncharacterized protein n=1 Tax=Anaeramoeba ignava TaxID=1746090 RepID=A0A9Q0L7Q0_ANAIG|nr:hypothetical protein M0811_13087 [Anaeramoeba ignava]